MRAATCMQMRHCLSRLGSNQANFVLTSCYMRPWKKGATSVMMMSCQSLPLLDMALKKGGVTTMVLAVAADMVYMIDKVHQGVSAPTARFVEMYEDDAMEPDIKTLSMVLEALEADRESMCQALLGMRTKKAQLMLLREIEQQLAKDATLVGTGVEFVPVVHHLPRKQAVGVADRSGKIGRHQLSWHSPRLCCLSGGISRLRNGAPTIVNRTKEGSSSPRK